MTKFQSQNKFLPVRQAGKYQISNIRTKVLVICILVLFCHLCFGIWDYSFAGKAEDDLFVAEKAFEDGFYEISLGLLEKFNNDYPESDLIVKSKLLIGKCLFYKGKYLKALSAFEELLASSNAAALRDSVLYWIAEVHFKGQDYAQARVYYERLIQEYPESSYAAFARYSRAYSFFEEENFAQAKKAFLDFREKFPRHNLSEDAAFKIALCYYNLKEYTAAKENFSAYIKDYPGSKIAVEALFYKAECLYYLGDFNGAITDYSKVIEEGADSKLTGLSRLGLGWAQIKLKDYAGAESAFDKIEAKDNRLYAGLLLGRAEISKEKQDFKSALKFYDEFIENAPGHESILLAKLGRADSLYALLRYPEAIAAYKFILGGVEAQKDKPGIPEIADKVHYNLAWAELKAGNFSEAISEFQKVASISSDAIIKISALCQVADTYQDLGEYQQAIDTYDKILSDYPESLYSDYVQYRQSICLLKMGRFDNALLGLKNLKVNFPDSKIKDDAEYYIGVAYFQKQDFNGAYEQLENFVSSFPGSPLRGQAFYLKAACLFNLGRYKQAQDAFMQVIKEYPQDTDLAIKCEYEIANCLYQDNEKDAAIKKFKEILSRYPGSKIAPEAVYFLGEHYNSAGDKDISARYFQRLISDYPESDLACDARYSLGNIYFSGARYDDALGQFNGISGGSCGYLAAQASLAAGDVYLKKGEIDEAVKKYEFVLNKYSAFAEEAYVKLASIYESLGRNEDAIAAYRKALEKAGPDEAPEINFRIADVLEQSGRINEAIEAYLANTYLYAEDKYWLAKNYLRLGRLFEDKENWPQAKNIYAKVAAMDIEEAKFAKEKLEEINKVLGKGNK